MKKIAENFLLLLKNWRTLETGLHGFLQNCARPKKVCKKTSETSAGQSSFRGLFIASRDYRCAKVLTSGFRLLEFSKIKQPRHRPTLTLMQYVCSVNKSFDNRWFVLSRSGRWQGWKFRGAGGRGARRRARLYVPPVLLSGALSDPCPLCAEGGRGGGFLSLPLDFILKK